MAFLVLILGLFSTAIGFAMIGFGIPINEFGLGNTLIGAGVTSLVGGLILFGLAAGVRQLERISEVLAARGLTRTARTTDIRAAAVPVRNGPRLPAQPRVSSPEAAAPAPSTTPVPPARREPRVGPASPVSFSFDAIERMRSNIPRTDRAADGATAADHDDETPLSPHAPTQGAPFPMPQPAPVDHLDSPVGGDARTQAESRLAFPWRRPRPSPEPRRDFESSTATMVEPRRDVRTEVAPAAAEAPYQPAPADQPVAILKSGVVDGMAYTLYADGSIEAKLPEGTVRFGSITELREHLEQNG